MREDCQVVMPCHAIRELLLLTRQVHTRQRCHAVAVAALEARPNHHATNLMLSVASHAVA